MGDNALVLKRAGPSLIQFDDAKKELIRTTIARDLSAPEFELFISMSSARGLDPVLKQIYAVKRKLAAGSSSVTYQVGIDGFRLIAARTGEHAGTDDTVFKTDKDGNPIEASTTVYRMVQGQRVSYTATARWREYCPGPGNDFMWKKMPFGQLGKCSEALSLRKGFPGDLGGLYIPEELERDITPTTEIKGEAAVAAQFEDDEITKSLNTLLQKFKTLGISSIDIGKKLNIAGPEAVTAEHIAQLNRLGSDIKNKRTTVKDEFPWIGAMKY